jgi:aspartate kinase
MEAIIGRHRKFAAELIGQGREFGELNILIDQAAGKLRGILRGISITRELTPRTRDAALSFGELFALIIIDAFLAREGFSHKAIDAAELIATDSNYGNARPVIDKTRANVESIMRPAIDSAGLAITQGFVARSMDGEITTMGIESSNLTAILLAGMLGVDSVTFYTDVDGILCADPEIIPDARRIGRMDYDTAYRAALSGLKLIYPPMIEIARRNGIGFVFRNAFNGGDSTLVSTEGCTEIPPIIILKEHLSARRFVFRRKPDLERAAEYLTSAGAPPLFALDSAPPAIFAASESPKLLSIELPVEYTSYEFRSIGAISIIIPKDFSANDYLKKISAILPDNTISMRTSGNLIRIFASGDCGELIRNIHDAII